MLPHCRCYNIKSSAYIFLVFVVIYPSKSPSAIDWVKDISNQKVLTAYQQILNIAKTDGALSLTVNSFESTAF